MNEKMSAKESVIEYILELRGEVEQLQHKRKMKGKMESEMIEKLRDLAREEDKKLLVAADDYAAAMHVEKAEFFRQVAEWMTSA